MKQAKVVALALDKVECIFIWTRSLNIIPFPFDVDSLLRPILDQSRPAPAVALLLRTSSSFSSSSALLLSFLALGRQASQAFSVIRLLTVDCRC